MDLSDLVAFHTPTGQVCISTESRPHNVICLPSGATLVETLRGLSALNKQGYCINRVLR
jgi:hypothetical protein